MDILNRAGPGDVALETTLLVHGIPRDAALPLCRELAEIAAARGARTALIGLLAGRPIVGMTEHELATLLAAHEVPKVNTSNLGLACFRARNAATTVSATMEIAAAAGLRLFATGGLGGVHRGYAQRLDISADLAALARFPVAVVCSGVKSLLDVESTREALESLGVPVVGFGTDRFPAFYRRASEAGVDARFDDPESLAAFLSQELARTGRAVVVANPIPAADEIAERDWAAWLGEAEARAGPSRGRAATPALLAALHEVSRGATLRANLALVQSNVALAATLASALARSG